jgi:hypothetical protein
MRPNLIASCLLASGPLIREGGFGLTPAGTGWLPCATRPQQQPRAWQEIANERPQK